MTGEDIIEALNRNIESKRREDKINAVGHLVLLRTIKINPTFKAYKTYEAIIYFVSYLTSSNNFLLLLVIINNCSKVKPV